MSSTPVHARLHLLLVAGTFFSTGLLLHADKIPVASPGNRMMPIRIGNKTAYIQVRDTSDAFKNVRDSGASDKPDQFSFSKTSPFANQTYAVTGSTGQDNGSYQKNLEGTFITKSYFNTKPDSADKTVPGLQAQVPIASADGYLSKASGYDRTYLTASASDEQNKSAGFTDKSSDDQGRIAVLGGHDIAEFTNPMANKTYAGPEMKAVKRDMSDMEQGLVSMKDLPNRPLTIDEVRALINHGVKPSLDQKAAEPSKALNDPTYTPEDAPAPMRASPADHLLDENDVNSVPSPGMIAHPASSAPESSEPLPQ